MSSPTVLRHSGHVKEERLRITTGGADLLVSRHPGQAWFSPIPSRARQQAYVVGGRDAKWLSLRFLTGAALKEVTRYRAWHHGKAVRIVSLIASATEIVDALGLGSHQVGRSHECDYPESVLSLPVCTTPAFAIDGSSAEIDRRVKERLASAVSVYEVFPEVLDRLQPSHIITQTQCRVCAVSLEDVERALAATVSSRPKVVPLEPNSLADIWADIRRVASACGITEDGERLVASLQSRMDDISRRANTSSRRPRVACIEWHEPLMAAGNWVPELVELAAAENLLGAPGGHSPYLSWEQLIDSDPDVILSTPCGFDLARTRAELYWLTENPAWPKLRAVRDGQVYLADGNQFFNRPGPSVVESLEILAEILHPELFPPALKNTGWERLSADAA